MTIIILIAVVKNIAIIVLKDIQTNRKLYVYNVSKFDYL